MKRYNFTINSYGYIIGYSDKNINEDEPILELEDDIRIFPGYSKILTDGTFIQNEGGYKQNKDKRKALTAIQAWFQINDWKINKIVLGEWSKDDPRWIEYVNERKIKREEQDRLIQELTIEGKKRN